MDQFQQLAPYESIKLLALHGFGDGFSGVTDIFLEAESSSLALTSFIMIINVPKCKQLDLKLDRVLIKYVVEG